MITQYVLLGAVITGITELLNRIRGRDFWTAATIICAAVTGAIFGLAHAEGLTVLTGIAAGFGASGALTAIAHIGNGSKATPREVLE